MIQFHYFVNQSYIGYPHEAAADFDGSGEDHVTCEDFCRRQHPSDQRQSPAARGGIGDDRSDIEGPADIRLRTRWR